MALLATNRLLSRHRPLVFALFGLLVALLFLASSRLGLQTDLHDLLPQRDPEVVAYRTLLTRFERMNRLLLAVGPISSTDGVSFEEASATAGTLAAAMRESGLFSQVRCATDPGQFDAALDALREGRASLFTDADRAALEARLTPEGLLGHFAAWRRLFLETPAPSLAQRFQRDPLGLDGFLLKKLEPLQALSGNASLRNGYILSPDGKWLLLTATPRTSGTQERGSQELVQWMENAIARAVSPQQSGKLQVAWLSGHRFGSENATQVRQDVRRVSIVSVGAILLLCFLGFRRRQFFILTFAPATFGAILATGAVGLFHPRIAGIVAGFGGMLVGILVDYGIQYLYQADRGIEPGEILARLGRPMIYGAATSMAVFLTLFAARFDGYRQLGWFTFLGILGAMLCALLLLPLWVKTPDVRLTPPWNPTPVFDRYFRWARRRRMLLLGATLALTAITLPGLFRLRFSGDLLELNAASPATRADYQLLTRAFPNALGSGSALLLAPATDQALEHAAEVERALEEEVRAGAVSRFVPVTPWMPPKSVRETNQERWREFWSPARIAALREDLQRAGREAGFKEGAFDAALAALPGPEAPVSVERLRDSLLGDVLAETLSEREEGAALLIQFYPAPKAEFGAIKSRIEAAGHGVQVTSGLFFTGHIAGLMRSETLRLGGLALLLNALLFFAFTRKVRDTLLILLPMALAAGWTMGIAGLTGRPATVLDGLVAVLILGLVSDYAIFLLAAGRLSTLESGAYLASVGSATLLSFLTTAAGLGALLVAQHPALRAVGINATLGLFAGFVAVLLLVPLAWGEGSATSDEGRVASDE